MWAMYEIRDKNCNHWISLHFNGWTALKKINYLKIIIWIYEVKKKLGKVVTINALYAVDFQNKKETNGKR